MKFKKVYLKVSISILIMAVLVNTAFIDVSAPSGAISNDREISYQKLANGEYQVVNYLGNQSEVSIPDMYRNQLVSAIDQYVFSENLQLEELKLSENIKFIGKKTFSGCSNLKRIIVPRDTAQMFSERLLNSTFSKNHKQIVLYEKDFFELEIDGSLVDYSLLQSGIYYLEKENNDVVSFELTSFEKPMFILKETKWKSDSELQKNDVSAKTHVSWYHTDILGNRKEVSSNNKLLLTNLAIEDTGQYSAEVSGDMVFRIQLDIGSLKGLNQYSIHTGNNLQFLKLIVLTIAGILSILYLIKKIKR